MKQEQVNEIIGCLKGQRTLFHYFKDRYCLDLLNLKMEADSMRVADLKTSNLQRFTQKSIVSEGLRHCANGRLSKNDLPLFWPSHSLPFVLTLAGWGSGDRGWDQTSRNNCNLVLQINFDNGHDLRYRQIVKTSQARGPFEYWGHPVRRDSKNTLSWVRMDIDFDTNEVLIEEVQNDWLRSADSLLRRLRRIKRKRSWLQPGQIVDGLRGDFDDIEHYVECVLRPYKKLWAEASLLAAILFIKQELGISNIYYHTFDTGNKIKLVPGAPPRSMYSKLPKQFGFELTRQAPKFLSEDKFAKRCIKAINDPSWYHLAV